MMDLWVLAVKFFQIIYMLKNFYNKMLGGEKSLVSSHGAYIVVEGDGQ